MEHWIFYYSGYTTLIHLTTRYNLIGEISKMKFNNKSVSFNEFLFNVVKCNNYNYFVYKIMILIFKRKKDWHYLYCFLNLKRFGTLAKHPHFFVFIFYYVICHRGYSEYFNNNWNNFQIEWIRLIYFVKQYNNAERK